MSRHSTQWHWSWRQGKVGVKLKSKIFGVKIVKKGQTYTLCSPKGLIQLNTRKKFLNSRVLWKDECGNLYRIWWSALLTIGLWGLKRFSLRKDLFWNIFKNQGGLHYFETQTDSWAKFERSWLFKQQCNAPLLEILLMKTNRNHFP